jgi:hypothetical protein
VTRFAEPTARTKPDFLELAVPGGGFLPVYARSVTRIPCPPRRRERRLVNPARHCPSVLRQRHRYPELDDDRLLGYADSHLRMHESVSIGGVYG